MSNKNKHNPTLDKINEVAAQAGLVLMTAAVTLGMLELPDHANSKVVMPSQPSFVLANENEEANNPIRREREDTEPHFISYSEVQRTASRSGRQ
ncbi:MAG TPA: hypothetical protein VHC21_02495 [Candidatus Saccharimonadales bacterium]|nr:hypothetical protein [Candidatus Saccharimonadales bacterium]